MATPAPAPAPRHETRRTVLASVGRWSGVALFVAVALVQGVFVTLVALGLAP